MKGTTNATQQTLFGEILNLRLVTNLSSHEDLIGVTIKINSLIYTWDGLDITVEIPAMMTYTIEAFEVEGYRTPEILTINSQIGNVNNVTLSYDCELVTINVSGSDGNTLDSSNVTINGKSGNKVPYGETYTVIANAIWGYIAPESLTYTANQPLRTVNMVYLIISIGVYIEDIDGNLYTEALWDGSKTANGIAVVTDNCRFVIAKQNASSSRIPWGGSGKNVSNIVTSTSSSTAVLDYDGAGNTPKIIKYLAGTNDGAPAAEACAAFTFPNGKKGYLPALGEWKTAYNNKTAVESAMTLIGGAAIQTKYHWSSTQFSSDTSWGLAWNNGTLDMHGKSTYYDVRAFTALKSDGEESEGGG